MKRTPVIKGLNFNVEQQTEFFVDITTLLGMKYYPSKSKDHGRIGLLFLFSSKMDNDYIYAQLMFDLENEEEVELMKFHPQNINNWSKEFKDKHFYPLVSLAKPGINSYGTNMIFSKPVIGDYYQFEVVYSNRDTKTDVIRKVNCPKSVWLQLSQFIYWFLCGYPVSSDIFLDDKYKYAKLYQVTGLIFDGSCRTRINNNEMVMAHFTMYWKSGIETGTFCFNIPFDGSDKTKIEKHPIDEKEYIRLYSKDDTISPDRMFSIPSPDRLAALLSGIKGENFYRIYTLDVDTVKRVDWLNWAKYIYLN